ncbi:MAG: crossover junction endodeoxyribonuclease RuvC [Clostridia bacterium]|nr:crossover junction endodeoxyribonuclease RuvC [Clostridia bacterium]MBR2324031.1 crossover junction endodeoxyribonuclease RuvC [Clostridia bacterium]MBR2398194.1 crossover junction endodeoxyribonuclease RuvC [Clostridia bacterium]
MRVLGIDPGYAIIGYGVLDFDKNKTTVIDYGVIETPKNEGFPVRLVMIEEGIRALLDKYQPDEVAIEELFFAKNVKTAINVAHARGIILATVVRDIGNIFEYTPLQIKQALTGFGRADKHQIQAMVKTLLNLKTIPKPDDAADAVAVALTHIQSRNFKEAFRI